MKKESKIPLNRFQKGLRYDDDAVPDGSYNAQVFSDQLRTAMKISPAFLEMTRSRRLGISFIVGDYIIRVETRAWNGWKQYLEVTRRDNVIPDNWLHSDRGTMSYTCPDRETQLFILKEVKRLVELDESTEPFNY